MAEEDDLNGADEEVDLWRKQREYARFRSVRRVKDFICLEIMEGGRIVNILGGLELHTGVFSVAEQRRIVYFVYELQEMGRNHQLREGTYLEPRKWMPGKGRITIQFGCCYNYAMVWKPAGHSPECGF